MYGIVFQQLGKLFSSVVVLAASDRNGAAFSHFNHGLNAKRRHRSFEPQRFIRRHSSGEVERSVYAEPIVPLNHDIHIRADGAPHCGDDLQSRREVLVVDYPPSGTKRIKLEGGIPSGYHCLCLFRKALRRTRAAVPTVGIGPQTLMTGSTQQVIQRLICRLAHDIPTSAFDGGQR